MNSLAFGPSEKFSVVALDLYAVLLHSVWETTTMDYALSLVPDLSLLRRTLPSLYI